MPVIWSGPGAQWGGVGLAVPCPLCNVEAGRRCLTTFSSLPAGRETHPARDARATALGFAWQPGAEDALVPPPAPARAARRAPPEFCGDLFPRVEPTTPDLFGGAG